jgi:hypothetical protein
MMETNDNTAKVFSLPQLLRPRHVPNGPQDAEFLQEHLNDPNYDLGDHSKSIVSADTLDAKKEGDFTHDFSVAGTDLDTESQAESTRISTTSRMLDFTDFDE